MRHVSRTHRVALDWSFDRINWDPTIQIKYIDTKNQFAYMLTKGNFTRDEWNHLLCLFNWSHLSSINGLEAMSKRTQEDAGEERVTAKSKPMMSLIARAPWNPTSSASESPVKKKKLWKSESILGVRKLREERTGRQGPKDRIWLLSRTVYWELISQHASQSGMLTKLGLLKSGRERHFDVWSIGQPVVTSWWGTRVPIKFLSREDPVRWNSAIHWERGNTSW